MRKAFYALTFFFISNAGAQTFTLTVNNGYGSAASFRQGDTLHLWSVAFDSTKVFEKWTGDTAGIEKGGEWHTTIIAPDRNITVTANLRSVSPYSISFEKIRGKNNLKNVYSYFPSAIKGVIYCLHGTGGHAVNWTTSTEYRQFVNAAIADSFGVIITEAEEITLNTDINGDGKLRWFTFPTDSINNVDYANIKAITDTFINRRKITTATPRYSVGMSNGGAFSTALSMLYKYKSGVSYCASGSAPVINNTTSPLQFCMAKYDDNAEVGPQGNADALANYNTLIGRNVCSGYNLFDRSPCYPQRFSRIKGISITASQNVFNEFVSKGFMDNRKFFIVSADTIATRVQNNPWSFPAVISLTGNQRAEILAQVAAMNAAHQFYSDFTSTTLHFLRNPCGTISANITAGGPVTFCMGGNVTLTANNGTGFSCQWLKNNVNINGAISQNYIANASGSYMVKISGANGVTAISNAIIITVNALPAPQINPSTATICPGTGVTLNTTSSFSSYLWSTGAVTQSISVTAAGTYTVSVSNAAGCRGSVSAVVSSSACNAPANLFASAVSGSSAQLNWSAAGCAYSYKLQYRKSGTTSWTSITVSPPAVSRIITGLARSTAYQWRIRTQCNAGATEQSGWSAIQSFTTAASAGRSLSQLPGATGEIIYSVYPNPASYQLHIEMPYSNHYAIEVMNVQGRIVLTAQDKNLINISGLAKGIYFITVKTDNSCFTQKFIRE